MDFRDFSPLTNTIRREERTYGPLDEFSDRNFFGGGLFPGRYFDEASTCNQQGVPFRMSGMNGFDRSNFRGQGIPFDMFAARKSYGHQPRLRLIDTDPAGHDARSHYHALRADRLPGRARFIDVVDEGRFPRNGIGRGREDRLPSLDPLEAEYHRDRSRPPETRRATLSPRSNSRDYRHSDPRALERQFRNNGRRLSFPGADRHADWNPKAAAPREDAFPFGKAMQWLHTELISAESFHQKFQREYDNQVKPLTYASGETLKKLWLEKVAAKAAPAASQAGSQAKKSGGNYEEQFAENKKILRAAMEVALQASLRLGEQDSANQMTLEARKRLQEKVDIACHHVMTLLDLATKAHDHCKALLGELKLLKELVDPKKNKDLFEGGEVGNAVGSSGQDNRGSNEDGYNNDDQQTHDWENLDQ